MRSSRRMRAAVLSSAIAATVVFTPVGFQQASAATPSETHVSAAVIVPEAPRDYRRGYRDGFRIGYRDADDNCRRDWRGFDYRNRDYERGFRQGYRDGFREGRFNFC
jgi:flagellar biosynthesis/type III secretory pathway protein FliH